MDLKNRVAAVLKEPAVQRIRFQIGGLPVNSSRLDRVADKIRSEEIHVYIWEKLKNPAEYVPVRDSILLRDADVFSDSYGKSMIVHEAVHAMIDMNEAKATTLFSSEVAAYLAQVIYDLVASRGNSKFRFKALIMNPDGRVARESLALIDKFKMTNTIVNVKWQDYQALREAIKANPAYRDWGDKQLFPADGLKPPTPKRQDRGCGC
jgi:hypothetical protein